MKFRRCRLSKSEGHAFADWLDAHIAETSGFTALVILLSMSGNRVEPITCSYVHVIGNEVSWTEMKALLDGSGMSWDGVAIFVACAPGGGPVIDLVAKAKLQQRIEEVTMNRKVLNESGFFDRRGRKIRIDPVEIRGQEA